MPSDMSGNVRWMLPYYIMAALVAIGSINAIVLFLAASRLDGSALINQLHAAAIPFAAASSGWVLLRGTLSEDIAHYVPWLADDVPAACAFLRNKID